MTILAKRSIQCDVCGFEQMEEKPGDGWSGWGQIQGVVLNGVANPSFCPKHFSEIMEYVDRLADQHKEED